VKREVLALLVVSIVVAGSGQNGDGERSNFGADFFEHLDVVKGRVTFGFGEHAIANSIFHQTDFIRRTAATELQRRTAEKNAKIYYARLTPKKEADLKAKSIRYILIPTVKSAETSPKAEIVGIIFDNRSRRPIDKYVYEFKKPV
jgi:hypothetical protein